MPQATRVRQMFSLLVFVLLVDVLRDAPGEQKTADLHQAADSSVEIFSFGRLLSRTSTLAGQGTLPSPTTGCRIRFIESLLMLRTSDRLAEAGCQTLNEKPTLSRSFCTDGPEIGVPTAPANPDSIDSVRYFCVGRLNICNFAALARIRQNPKMIPVTYRQLHTAIRAYR